MPDNIDELGPRGKKAAKELSIAQPSEIYETQTQKESPEPIYTFRYRGTVPGQTLGTIWSIFDDGESHVRRLLANLTNETLGRFLGKMISEIDCATGPRRRSL